VNDDGYSDLVVSTHNMVYSSSANGGGLVVYGGGSVSDVSETSITGSQGFLFYCSDNSRKDAGHYSRNAGDFNGDGIGDFAVTSPNNVGNSTGYIVFGSNSLSNPYDICSIPAGGGVWITAGKNDQFGDFNVDSGDLDGGIDDENTSAFLRLLHLC